MPRGTDVIDFGSTPTDEASVVVSGQTGIGVNDSVEAFFMREVGPGDNGLEEHEEMAANGRLVCGDIVDNTSFKATAIFDGLATGTFNFRFVRNTVT